MPNSFITYLDSKEDLNLLTLLQVLAKVGFIKHQYQWLIEKLRTDVSSKDILFGYTGVKKSNAYRDLRINTCVKLLKTLPATTVLKLPNNIPHTLSDPDIESLIKL